jgi:gamma-glutamyl:cysteine ligase YbdK (ATP-grasp superfamily)
VDRATLDVRPISDEILRAVAGEVVSEVEVGALAWSNELVMHVIELKTNGPAPVLSELAQHFQADARRIDGILEPLGARLMPGAMHPWMDPDREKKLWSYEYSPVYELYDKIFSCNGHGWANLQSMHVNLPFADDAEFERLHAAIRLVLPILPALSASSPVLDGRLSPRRDERMRAYQMHTARVPSLTGSVVPEPVWSRAAYERDVLGLIWSDLAPHDPEGVLRHEFANARGAIARFDRNAIEIRVIDTQECPAMDLAIAGVVTSLLQALVAERWISLEEQKAWDTERLARILWRVVDGADEARVEDEDYLAVFDWKGARAAAGTVTAGDLWRHLAGELAPRGSEAARTWLPDLRVILEEGALASRITHRLAAGASRLELEIVWRELCDCLHEGRAFHGRA